MKYLSIIFISFLLPLTTAAQIYYSEAYNIKVTEENDSINDPFTGGFNNAQFSEIDLNQDGKLDYAEAQMMFIIIIVVG